MNTLFPDNKEPITCNGGPLDGRQMLVTRGMQRFEVLLPDGSREAYVREGDGGFAVVWGAGKSVNNYMPCSQ